MMDYGQVDGGAFTVGISLVLYCGSQAVIECYWEKLSYYPEEEVSG
ncbi:hypothetical protein ACF3NG_00465 [Aerococcaceae bacterium WGS1372]